MDHNKDLLGILRVSLNPSSYRQVDLYVRALRKYLDQFSKIKSSEQNQISHKFHINDINSRFDRLKSICSDILDRLEPVLDEEQATVLFLYTSNLTVYKSYQTQCIGLNNSIKFNPNAIVNFTPIVIPTEVQIVLSLGPKFCFPNNTNNFNWSKILSELDMFAENNLQPMQIGTFSKVVTQKLKVVDRELTQQSLHPSYISEFLENAIKATRSFLKNEGEDLYILNADKGNKTVVMHKETYSSKINDMMSDQNTYLLVDKLSHHPDLLKRKHNGLIEEFIKYKLIKKCDKWKYCKNLYACSKFYGLPKTHKPDFSLRPITCTINSLGYDLATFLSEYLKYFDEQNSIHISDSLQLKQFLDNFTLPEDHILVSFDVISMFTNIPVKTALLAVKRRMLKAGCNHKVINLVYRSLEFVLTSCAIFSADGRLYKQIGGLAMGSPLSPILSRFVMSDLVKERVTSLPQLNVGFFKIYVDDSLVSVHRECIDSLLLSLNSYHSSIQFTYETDIPSPNFGDKYSINFLDMTIFRSLHHNKLSTCWYKKPYSSGRLLNYFSNHSKGTINGVATNFVNKVFNLSNYEYRMDNIHTIFNILSLNSYPTYYITKLVLSILKGEKLVRDKPQQYVPITYSKILFDNIKTIVKEFCPNISLCGKPDNSNLGYHFSRLKDQEDQTSKQNCVVGLTCKKCHRLFITHTKYDCNVGDLLDSTSKPRPSHNCNHCLDKTKPKILGVARSHTNTKILFPYIHASKSEKVVNVDVQPRNFPFYKFNKDRIKTQTHI